MICICLLKNVFRILIIFSFKLAFQFSMILTFPSWSNFSVLAVMFLYYNLQSLSSHRFSLLISLFSVPHISLVALSKYRQNAFQEPGRCSVHPDTLFSWQTPTQLKSLLPTFLLFGMNLRDIFWGAASSSPLSLVSCHES